MTGPNDILFSATDHPRRLAVVHGRRVRHHFSRHVHRSYTVGMILSGYRCMEILDRRHILDPGTCFLINPGVPHTCWPIDRDKTEQSYFVLAIPPETLQPKIGSAESDKSSRSCFTESVVHDDTLSRHMAALARSPAGDKDGTASAARVITLLQTKYTQARHAPGIDPRISAALDFFAKHPDKVATIDQLAAIAGLSIGRFCHVFKQRIGIPPYTYDLQLRINRARELLNQATSLADVAYATGFSDQSHLTRMFKRYTGITPGQYADQTKHPHPPH